MRNSLVLLLFLLSMRSPLPGGRFGRMPRGAEDDVLSSVHFIHRGQPFGIRLNLLLPKQLSSIFVVGMNGAVRPGRYKNQSARGHNGRGSIRGQ